MNVEEIEQAISELSSAELAQFRKWFEEFKKKRAYPSSVEEQLKRLRGSLKGKGILKAYLTEKQQDKELFEYHNQIKHSKSLCL